MNWELAAWFAIAYVLGAIPFGVLIARANGVDLFTVGSGNTGATNVYRVLGKGPGLTVFALDVLKGLVPALATHLFFSADWGLVVGLVAVAGHSLSPFIGFRGGKGISTGLGALLGSYPAVALGALGVFLVVFGVTGYVSLASIASAVGAVVFGALFASLFPGLALFVGLLVFVVIRHLPNIERLRAGTEPKFSLGGSGGGEAPPAGRVDAGAPEADADASEP